MCYEEDEVLQINALIYTMGKEAEHVFKAFSFAEGSDKLSIATEVLSI